MASASSTPDPMVSKTYFCHQCGVEIPRVLDDFTCPTCQSGFIEEINVTDFPPEDEDDMDEDDHHAHSEAEIAQHIFESLIGGGVDFTGGGGRRPGARFTIGGGPASRTRGSSRGGGAQQPDLGGTFFQDLLSNLTGIPVVVSGSGAMGGPGSSIHFMPATGGFQLYGNPGDYAWGRGGIDQVVTQLLNQMDGAGPPPLAQETIDKIPSVKISQTNVDDKLQCSVCWEDFKLDENVRRLTCDHIFHDPCLVPWLKLHDTCPVCRKSQADCDREAGRSATQPQQQEQQASSQSYQSFTSNPISAIFNQFLGVPSSSSSVPSSSSPSDATASSASSRESSHRSSSNTTNTTESEGSQQQRRDFNDFDLE